VEEFQRANPGSSVIVESTGTGAGIKLFCGGVGGETPDMVNASRPMKASEYADCAKAGVKQVIEVPVGIDGLTLIQAKEQPPLNLTVAQIYKALAANPFGKPQTAQTWQDVDPSLPATKIRVLGPPPTSGTRDSLAELILEKGCDSDPAMKALKEKDKDAHKATCTKIREDGAFVEAGENDNLLVQKVSADPGALGVLGYSFLEENADRVAPVSIAGVAPTEATISDLSYPGSRRLYIYVKGEHLAAKPAIKQFIEAYSKAWGKGGLLAKRGLVPLAPAEGEAATQQATALKPLDPASLK
jgi:phosphate transport system substrate-binding protein